MIVGGLSKNDLLKDAEFLDFSSDKKAAKLPKPADFPKIVYEHAASFVGGQGVVCGGFDTPECFSYSFSENEWRKADVLPWSKPRGGAASFTLDGENMYILGGRHSIAGLYWDSTLIYAGGKLRNGPYIPRDVYYPCVVPINGTHVFYAGGFSDAQGYRKSVCYAHAYLVEVASWTWTRLEDMRAARTKHACGRAGRSIVVAGGSGLYNGVTTTEILSLDTLKWSEGPRAPTPSGRIQNAAVFQRKDTFYILGGTEGSLVPVLDTVYEFEPEGRKWKKRKEKLSKPRYDFAIIPVPKSVMP